MSELRKDLADLLRSSAEQLADEIGRAMNAQSASARNTPARTEPAASASFNAIEWAALGEPAASTSFAQTKSTTKAASSEAASTASTISSAVLGGMGLSPILSALLSLFGGGDEPAPALPRYSAPAAVRVNAGIRSETGAAVGVDYGQGGEVREVASGMPSVVVNVSAMDTQSFLDRSDDIALAVKRALLESHSLNDVIAEL